MKPNLTHEKRYRRFIKYARKFDYSMFWFWNSLFDESPEFCFVCGNYIPIPMRNETYCKRPTRKGDMCHIKCFNNNVDYNMVHKKLDEDSLLICHIERPTTPFVRQPICRARVKNNSSDVYQHVEQVHNGIIIENDLFLEVYFKSFRNSMFLKPTGKPFPKPRQV